MRLVRACRNSWDGIVHALRTEAAVRLEAMVLVVAVPLAVPLSDTPTRFVALVGSVLLVMVVELLNTAVEKLADRVQPERDPAIKIVKDLGSAAVTTSILIGVGCWAAAAVEILGR